MKTPVSLTLCAALVLAPLEIRSTPSQGGSNNPNVSLAAICLFGAAAVIGGYVYFKVRACAPKYYCVEDEDGNRFPSNATRTERAANDWKVKSGPYKSAEEAAKACPPATTSTAALVMVSLETADEVAIPQVPIKIWKSANLASWTLADTILDDPSHFSWTDTNAISGQMFYRASY